MTRATTLALAADLHERGVAANAEGRPGDAADHLSASLRWLDEAEASDQVADLQVRVLMGLAVAMFEVEGVTAAMPLLDRAAVTASHLDAPELVGLCHSQRANLLGRSGRMAEALAELDRAAAELDALGPRDQVIVLMNRGVASSHIGSLDVAMADLGAAARIAGEHGLNDQAFMALHNQGWVMFLAGDLPGALSTMAQADAIDSDVSRATALLDRGRVLLEAGLTSDAELLLGRAIEMSAATDQHHAEAEALYELCRTHEITGRIEDMRSVATDALDRFDRRGVAVWVERCRLLAARAAVRCGGDLDEAEAVARHVIAAAGDIDPVLAQEAHVVLADILITAGRVDDARAAMTDVQVGEALLPSLSARLERRRVAVSIAAACGETVDARRLLEEAEADLAGSSAMMTSLDVRTAQQVHAVRLGAQDIELAGDDAASVLRAIERWRALVLRLPPMRTHEEASTAALLAEVRRRREQVRQTPSDADAVRELRRLEEVAAAALRASGGTMTGETAGAIDLAQMTAALAEDGTTLLATTLRDGQVIGVLMGGGRSELRVLGEAGALADLARRVRADLAMAAQHRLGPLHDAVWGSLFGGIAELRARLLDPFGDVGDRLVIAPHGALSGLPWGMVTDGRPVVASTSASSWLVGRARASASASSLLGRAGAPPRPISVHVLSGPRLAGAAAEAKVVGTAWESRRGSADVTSRPYADVDDFHGAMARGDVVHVAAHGTHHAQNPMFSSVELSGGAAFLYDLDGGQVGAGHVVLAACDVGRATARPGDQLVGLATGMLALGVRSVLAPVCTVPDEMVPDLMGAYHRSLAAGTPSDVAIADAAANGPDLARTFVTHGSPWHTQQP